MDDGASADTVVFGPIYTAESDEILDGGFAVTDGLFEYVGHSDDVNRFIGPRTEVIEVESGMVMPGFSDGHIHLGLGGSQAAWELAIDPEDSIDDILRKIGRVVSEAPDGDWIVGGIIGSPLVDRLTPRENRARLDAVTGNHPVMIRDDSMHNRWVNSETISRLGIDRNSVDPVGGSYGRDHAGELTGVLFEITSAEAERLFAESIENPEERDLISLTTALSILASFGITSVQDAATMSNMWRAMKTCESRGEMTAWVVGSMPTRPFLEDGITGHDLYPVGLNARSHHVRPDFLKIVMDGVPTSRTAAMLAPYLQHSHGGPAEHGHQYWELSDLISQLEYCAEKGFGAKIHCCGDAAVHRSLDAIEQVRKTHGSGMIVQIAHAEFIADDDLPRFSELGVVPDLSPYIWYPSVIVESIREQVSLDSVATMWPIRQFVESGSLISAGSDWPCALPTPDPWVGLETMITRANPDNHALGTLNFDAAVDLATALRAFTINSARSMGLGHLTGSIAVGKSADFIVIDQNLFDIEPSNIHHTRVRDTYFEGRRVFSLG